MLLVLVTLQLVRCNCVSNDMDSVQVSFDSYKFSVEFVFLSPSFYYLLFFHVKNSN